MAQERILHFSRTYTCAELVVTKYLAHVEHSFVFHILNKFIIGGAKPCGKMQCGALAMIDSRKKDFEECNFGLSIAGPVM